MHTVRIVLLILFAALGLYALARLHNSNKRQATRKKIQIWDLKIVPRPLASVETDWFDSTFVPFNRGQYKVRRKYRDGKYMHDDCIWNGKEWLSTDGKPSYFQDWEFRGLTQRVAA